MQPAGQKPFRSLQSRSRIVRCCPRRFRTLRTSISRIRGGRFARWNRLELIPTLLRQRLTVRIWICGNSNGTTGGTIRLAGLGPADNQSRQLTNVNGTLYFRGYDAVEGHELWKSSGTVAGTSIVRSLRTGIGSSTLTDLTNFNGTLAFSGNGDLYKSNGTSAGTVRVSDLIARTSDGVAELEPVGNKLFFRAKSSAGGFDLYHTDGTRAGTSKVENVPAGDLTKLTKVGSSLYFVRNDSELWKTSADNSTSSMIAAAHAANETCRLGWHTVLQR